ncbi:hypothetical protein FF38_13924 [Lucilia cuprina]|uniref:Uncharacterized protein n=1 Tax=Lucilia cuprina TaxID=7375 RepID=A0A0L0BPY0_LUCCU|nr:hypothetical protein FF38_13924 [Lucilia cuprina]
MDDVVAPPTPASESALKNWRVKHSTGTLEKKDFIEFFQKESRKYFEFQHDNGVDKHQTTLMRMKTVGLILLTETDISTNFCDLWVNAMVLI